MDQESLDGHLHIIPDEDIIDHIAHSKCECRPDWDLKNKKEFLRGQAECKLYIHNRLMDTPH